MIQKKHSKSKKSKYKLCPDCKEGHLHIVEYSEEKDSVVYAQKFYECDVCGYAELIRNRQEFSIE